MFKLITMRSRIAVVLMILCGIKGSVQSAGAHGFENRVGLWSVDWSADGGSYAVGGAWTGVFDAKTNERRLGLRLEGANPTAKVRWHPRRDLVAIAGGGDATAIYDMASGKRTLLETKEGTRSLAWDAGGDLLATAGNRGELQIWNAEGKLLHTTRPENAKSLTGVAWNPAGDRIVTVGEFIILYDGKGKIIKQVRHRPGAKGMLLLLCAEWHPSGEFFVTGDYGNDESGDAPALQFWSPDGTLLKTMEVKGGAAFRNVSWNRDGTMLASASDALRIWSKDGQVQHTGHSPDLLWGIRWDRDGRRLLTAGQEGRVTLWTAEAVVSKKVVDVPEPVSTPSGLKYLTILPGKGAAIAPGQFARIHETASLTDGTVLYSTRTKGVPLKFLPGGNQVIAGLDESVRGMKAGERRRLVVPPSLSQRTEYPANIPKNATLLYDVELVEILDK